MVKKAFSLIELIVYLAIFSIFTTLSFGFLSKFYKDFFYYLEKNKNIIRNTVIIDLLRRDLMSAYSDLIYWDEKKFVFRKKHINKITDISWEICEDSIHRIEGNYNYIKKFWVKKNIAVLDYSGKKFNWLLGIDDSKVFYKYIIVEFEDNKKLFINFRNGIF